MAQELWQRLKSKIESGEYLLPGGLEKKLLELGDIGKDLSDIKSLVLEVILKYNKGA